MKVIVILACSFLLYRLYIIIGRRCTSCGSIFKNKRNHKILLALDESISFRSPKTKKLRWWIRRVRTFTYTSCPCGWKAVVKTSRGPISVVHARWVKLTDKEQYTENGELSFLFEQEGKNYGNIKSLNKHAEQDTPPINIQVNLDDFNPRDW